MPVPKRKRSRSRRDKRFANKGVEEKAMVHCANCQEPLVPHRACGQCGFYKGVKVLRTKADRGLARQAQKDARKKAEPSSPETPTE